MGTMFASTPWAHHDDETPFGRPLPDFGALAKMEDGGAWTAIAYASASAGATDIARSRHPVRVDVRRPALRA